MPIKFIINQTGSIYVETSTPLFIGQQYRILLSWMKAACLTGFIKNQLTAIAMAWGYLLSSKLPKYPP